MTPCPYCRSELRYTDPNNQVRCTNCFNHLDGTPDTPMGRKQDLDAPMTVMTTSGNIRVYPNTEGTR